MPRFAINRFAGSTPRLAKHLGSESTAGRALDCKLWHGTLEAWREPQELLPVAPSTLSVYQHGCCWLEFDECVDVALGGVSCNRLYATGAWDYPVVLDFDDPAATQCAPVVKRLGLPCPTQAPAVTPLPGSAAPKDTEASSWAYQWVNSEGYASALSPASAPVIRRDGDPAQVIVPARPDETWDIQFVNIYRAVGGYQEGGELGNNMDTAWMLVDTVPAALAGPTVYTDNTINEELQSAVEEDMGDPPPAGLQGMIYIEGQDTLAGFTGRRLWFTTNNFYHEWPHYIDLDDNICAITESNGIVYVATDGAPYAVSADPQTEDGHCWQAVRLPGRLPMVGCGSHRFVSLPGGAIYPSHDGLILLSGNATPRLFTNALYAPDDWHRLFPETVMPVYWNGFLFVFARGGAFVLRLPSDIQGDWELDYHSELSDRQVRYAHVTRNGELVLLKDDALHIWDRGNELRPYHWQSLDIVLPSPVNFSAVNARTNGPVRTRIWVEGREVADRDILHAKPFRLPAWGLGERWNVELTGTGKVSIFEMATSMREL